MQRVLVQASESAGGLAGRSGQGARAGTVVRLVAGTYPGTLFGSFGGCSRNNPDGDPTTFDCEVDMVDDRFIQIQLLGP